MSEETLAGLRWIRDDYSHVVASAGPADLEGPSDGTRWTNGQLLFHMWFGQRIARVFVPLFGVLGRLPRPLGVGYARLLSALTRPYNWVNFVAPVGGARLVGPHRTDRWMRADTDWLLRWATAASDKKLGLTAHVPAEWDPYFSSSMSRADILDWAPKHYRHHRNQLTLPATRRSG